MQSQDLAARSCRTPDSGYLQASVQISTGKMLEECLTEID